LRAQIISIEHGIRGAVDAARAADTAAAAHQVDGLAIV